MSRRVFQKSQRRSRNDAREVLEHFFLAETLAPSRQLWIVSPWLRNFVLFDNRNGGFEAVLPDAPRRELRLLDVLREQLMAGTGMTVVTRAPPYDGGIHQALKDIAVELGCPQLVRSVVANDVHTKGVVGESAAIIGSMNFTHSGIEANTELVELTNDSEVVSRLALEFTAAFGAVRVR